MVDVIGAGFGRTGTASLKQAMEMLGFDPCHHMLEIAHHPETSPGWTAAVNGDPSQLPAVLAGYRATMDFPGCLLWREMMELYPDAKVVLSVRDPKKWYDSARATILNPDMAEMRAEMAKRATPQGLKVGEAIGRLGAAMSATGFDRDRGEAELIEMYLRHNEIVRESVEPNRLLVYEVGEGWEPLCTFLGVDVPEESFPHVNDSASFWQNVSQMLTTGAADFK
jgi:hypothetical protein